MNDGRAKCQRRFQCGEKVIRVISSRFHQNARFCCGNYSVKHAAYRSARFRMVTPFRNRLCCGNGREEDEKAVYGNESAEARRYH